MTTKSKVCPQCKKASGYGIATGRGKCLHCWADETGKEKWSGDYWRTGRPKGSTQYEEPKTIKSHRMTPAAHEFIKANKDLIERMARTRHEVQYKMNL